MHQTAVRNSFKPEWARYIEIDREIAEKMHCKKCGANMRYEGMVDSDGAYVALAVCTKCGKEVAF